MTLYIVGSPRITGKFPDNGVDGLELDHNYTISVWILSNPFPTITPQNWTFVDDNGTEHAKLPDNVYTWEQPVSDRLTIEANLHIDKADISNYGNYTLTTGNEYGLMLPLTFRIRRIGLFPHVHVTTHQST